LSLIHVTAGKQKNSRFLIQARNKLKIALKAEFLQQNDSVLITVVEKMTSTDTGLLDSRRCENHLMQVAQQRRIFFLHLFPVVRSNDLT
jgi:hypothetical protein